MHTHYERDAVATLTTSKAPPTIVGKYSERGRFLSVQWAKASLVFTATADINSNQGFNACFECYLFTSFTADI